MTKEAKSDYYEGPVCYMDGWHWTAVTDADDKARRVAIAEAVVKHAEERGDEQQLAAARENLKEIQEHEHLVPGERLVLEDTEDGSESRYRLATDDDTMSWHERKHAAFVGIEFEDGAAIRINEEDAAAVRELLESRRSGGGK